MYVDVNTLAQELLQKGDECARLIQRLERSGNTVNFRIDWRPGITAGFQMVKSYEAQLTVNGIDVNE